MVELVFAAMELERLEALQDINSVTNAKHDTHMMETHMQDLIRIGRVCAVDIVCVGQAAIDTTRRRIEAAMPLLAQSRVLLLGVFSLAVNLGAESSPLLAELAGLCVQWLSPQIRKARWLTLAMPGAMLATVMP